MSNIKMADYSIDQTIRADATVRYGMMTGNKTAISALGYSARLALKTCANINMGI
ncbi:hypothetical protein V5094_13010 [Moellerella wisconsensis]|uniref:hypothetical protein n=1 Tax=Moellerella wisconsensis TaxID=158849 RepID=UPI00307676B9